MSRVVGIDFGMARLGIAISDERRIIARTLATLAAAKRSAETCSELLELLSPYTIERVVIGMPLHMNGKMGMLADEVKSFAALIEEKLDCAVVLWDERLTTVQAERVLREANMSRKKRSKVIDSMAAVILLQSYLDFEATP